MPELGRLGRRQIAALTGLAPWTLQPGLLRGKGFIGGGPVRSALFVDASVASQHDPTSKPFRDKLLKACNRPGSQP
jgi:transposase